MSYNFDNGGAYTERRRWTKEEVNMLKKYSDQNKTAKDIAKELNRTETSVYLKIKRLALDNNTYNQKHQLPKYLANRKYLDDLKPNSVLDLYAGNKSYYVDIKKIAPMFLDAILYIKDNLDASLSIRR